MAMEVSYYLQWYLALPILLGYGVIPGVMFLFFCRCCGSARVKGKWLWLWVYVGASAILTAAEFAFGLRGSPGLVLETGLLACCGKRPGRKGWTETFAVSVLVLSAFCVADGMISWWGQRILAPLILCHERFVHPSDGVRELLKTAAVLVLLGGMGKRFGRVVEEGDKKVLGWMTVPMFFIALVERIIRHSIYGDTLVADRVLGTVGGIIDVDHGEMLFVQVFACICLFLALFAYEKILDVFRDTEKLRMVRQQAMAQEIYIREAAVRYRQTRSFRHDIKNHLMVLEKLLGEGQDQEARNYLSQLKETAESLSFQVCTGNPAVDALLGSKLALAGQEGIAVRCDMKIPEKSGIKDMDWCMILANGMDNAIEACRKVDKSRRCLNLEGRRKGNFYLIFLENSCREGEALAGDGIGLSGIWAVAETYGGRVENEICHDRYRLRVLLVDSRQEKGD